MTPRRFETSDWDDIRLVAFDIDGTLYSQRRLRLRMLRDLLRDAAAHLTLDPIMVLAAYRRLREGLAEREVPDFENVLIAETARATGRSTERVRAIVEDWIERRPLPYLKTCRYPGVAELFAALRHKGKIVGVLSDYPARAKLAALDLAADPLVCAGDPGVGLLKPHPRGLETMIAKAGVSPRQTVLIGDRPERDGEAARRVGVWPLIRSARRMENWQTFAGFDDAIFQTILRT